LPEVFDMTAKILQNEPDLTVEAVIARLKRDEQTRAMRMKSEATTEAHYLTTNPGRGRGRGRGGRGGRQGASGRGNKWCTFCCTSTHDTEDCRSKQWSHKKKRRLDDLTDDSDSNSANPQSSEECFHCGGTGHFVANCPTKKRGDEARDRKKKRKMEAEDGY
jgi:hypothetical protein